MRKYLSVSLLFLILTGCVNVPVDTFHSRGVAVKNMQTRTFNVESSKIIILSCVSVLQDMGYLIEETNYNLGVVKGTKEAEAVQASQVTLNVASAILLGQINAIDDEQKITASVVIYDSDNKGEYYVRALFAQEVFKTNGFKSKSIAIEDKDIYSLFFQKLSKSVFLENNEL